MGLGEWEAMEATPLSMPLFFIRREQSEPDLREGYGRPLQQRTAYYKYMLMCFGPCLV
jgi:hypothetical protein